MDTALSHCESSIELLKSLGEGLDAGIASQNLIEELMENLVRVKELEVIQEEEEDGQVASSQGSRIEDRE